MLAMVQRSYCLVERQPNLKSVYDEIIASGAPEPGIAPMDLATATPDEIQKLAEVMEQQYGRLDGLLHNAAILGERVPVEHYDINTWMKVMQVNLHAVFSFDTDFLCLCSGSLQVLRCYFPAPG